MPLSPPALFEASRPLPEPAHGQEGGFRVCLSAFLTCKDTRHSRGSPLINFKFSSCYTWNKTRFLTQAALSLSSHSYTPCQPHWLSCCFLAVPTVWDALSPILAWPTPSLHSDLCSNATSSGKPSMTTLTKEHQPHSLTIFLSSSSSSPSSPVILYIYLIFLYLPCKTVSSSEAGMIVCSVHCSVPSTNSRHSIDTYWMNILCEAGMITFFPASGETEARQRNVTHSSSCSKWLGSRFEVAVREAEMWACVLGGCLGSLGLERLSNQATRSPLPSKRGIVRPEGSSSR